MIITRIETHDMLADLERIRPRAAPATLRLLRQLADAYQLLDDHGLASVLVQVKRPERAESSDARDARHAALAIRRADHAARVVAEQAITARRVTRLWAASLPLLTRTRASLAGRRRPWS